MGWNTTTEMLSRVAAGNVAGATAVNLIGYNAVPTTTFETLWDNSNAYAFLDTNMSSPTIVSSNAADDGSPPGTGAQTVTVQGVSLAGVLVNETGVILNGTSTVALTGPFQTINSVTVTAVGSGGVPAGNLTLAAGGVTHGYVIAGVNKSRQMIYHVPAGYSLLMFNFQVNEEAASAGGNRARIVYRTSLGPVLEAFVGSGGLNLPINQDFRVPLHFPANTQIQCQFLSAAATGVASAFASCILLDRTNTTAAAAFAKWI